MPPRISDGERSNRLQTGARIRECRLNAGFTLEHLAKAIGPEFDRRHVKKWEIGAAPISKSLLEEIATALRVPTCILTYVPSGDLPPRARLLAFSGDGPLSTVQRRQAESILTSAVREAHAVRFLAKGLRRFRYPVTFKQNTPFSAHFAESMAKQVRRRWGLGNAPIADVTHTLEKHGVTIAVKPKSHPPVVIAGTLSGWPTICWWGTAPRTPEEWMHYRLRLLTAALRTMALGRGLPPQSADQQARLVARSLLLPLDQIPSYYSHRNIVTAESILVFSRWHGIPIADAIAQLIEAKIATPALVRRLSRQIMQMPDIGDLREIPAFLRILQRPPG